MASPWTPRMRMRRLGRGSPIKLVKAHGNTKSVNGPMKPEESKRAAGPRKKRKGTMEPMSKNTSRLS